MTINDASRRLDVDNMFVHGCAVGLGINPELIGNSLVISDDDFARIEQRVSGYRFASRRSSRRPKSEATA